jgi:hypothetical protein
MERLLTALNSKIGTRAGKKTRAEIAMIGLLTDSGLDIKGQITIRFTVRTVKGTIVN